MKAKEGLGQSLPFLQPLASCIQPPQPNRQNSNRNALNRFIFNESGNSNREKPGKFQPREKASRCMPPRSTTPDLRSMYNSVAKSSKTMRLKLPPGQFRAYLFDCDGT